ncbi:MAG: hypothetical protein FWC86_04245 [Coriobacteriia bacterium]|nr:hypothetical protein [Coriobacteriia bacterium]
MAGSGSGSESKKFRLFRVFALAMIVSVVLGIMHCVSGELLIAAHMQFDYIAQDWYHSNPTVELWHGTVWIAIGIGVTLAFGVTSKSVKVAALQGFIVGLFVPLISILLLNLRDLGEPGSVGWFILALPIFIYLNLLPAVIGGLISVVGYGGKYFYRKKYMQ